MDSRERLLSYFQARSADYNKSSNWAGDQRLLKAMVDMARVKGDEVVLDLATGTGLVARAFRGKVKRVIGLDVSDKMAEQAAGSVDELLIGSAEAIPLDDGSVDLCVCRQGLQFMDMDKAVGEVARVLKPGGLAVFCQLAAYGELDKKEAFEIQRLRNPVRVNFFMPGDLERVMERHGFVIDKVEPYRSRESIAQWIDCGAVDEKSKAAIRNIYRAASADFKRLHEVEITDKDILDTMLLPIVSARAGAR